MQTATSERSKRFSRSTLISVAAILLTLTMMGAIATAIIDSQPKVHDQLGIKGDIVVTVDGKKVYSGDTIMLLDYDYVICKVFNDSSACANPGAFYMGYSSPTAACKTQVVGGTAFTTPSFWSRTLCSQIGIGLSTDGTSQANTSPTCLGLITSNANGMAPIKATTSHTINTNSIILSASWVATGTVSGLQKVCLLPYNDHDVNVVYGSTPASLAVDTFSSIGLTAGQSVSVQWTFTF